jgi:hypothetical protein
MDAKVSRPVLSSEGATYLKVEVLNSMIPRLYERVNYIPYFLDWSTKASPSWVGTKNPHT